MCFELAGSARAEESGQLDSSQRFTPVRACGYPNYRLVRRRLGLRVGVGRLGDFGRRRRLRSGPSSVLAKLAHTRFTADLAAKVVELRAVDVADRRHLDLVDLRRVQRERPLDADTERLLAHGERFTCACALALEHDSFEDLNALTLALDHLEVNAHGVPRLELRNPVAQLRALEAVDDVAHRERKPTGEARCER